MSVSRCLIAGVVWSSLLVLLCGHCSVAEAQSELRVEGTIVVGDQSFSLSHAVAANVSIRGKLCLVVLASEKPIPAANHATLFPDPEESSLDIQPFTYAWMAFDKDGRLIMTRVNTPAGRVGIDDLKTEDYGRVRDELALGKVNLQWKGTPRSAHTLECRFKGVPIVTAKADPKAKPDAKAVVTGEEVEELFFVFGAQINKRAGIISFSKPFGADFNVESIAFVIEAHDWKPDGRPAVTKRQAILKYRKGAAQMTVTLATVGDETQVTVLTKGVDWNGTKRK